MWVANFDWFGLVFGFDFGIGFVLCTFLEARH